MVISLESLFHHHWFYYCFLAIRCSHCFLSHAGFSDNTVNMMLIKNHGSIRCVVMDLITGHMMRTLEFPVYHDFSYINKYT